MKACIGRQGQSSYTLLENFFFIWWAVKDFEQEGHDLTCILWKSGGL